MSGRRSPQRVRRALAERAQALLALAHGAAFRAAARGPPDQWPSLPERVFAGGALRPRAAAPGPSGPCAADFALLMPVCDPRPADLARALASVAAQTHPRWRLICVDDASADPRIATQLKAAAATEPRIRLIERARRGGIAAATEDARRAAGEAQWLAFVDHDDILAPDALARLAAAIAAAPELRLLYTDECKVDGGERRSDAAYKPAWSPALLLGQNYINHLCAVRADAADSAGGLRPGFDGAQDLDLLLRLAETLPADAIGHVPAISYAWRHRARSRAFSRARAGEAAEAGRRAVQESLDRRGIGAEIALTAGGWRRVRPRLGGAPRISVVIPTRNNPALFARALMGAACADWPDLELIVVDHENTEAGFPAALDAARARRPVRVLPWTGPFNYAAKMNAAAAAATGAFLLLLNDDVTPLEPRWLERMAGWMAFEDVAAVGATLLYPTGLVQHAGLALGIGGSVGTPLKRASAFRKGPFARLRLTREVAAATAACLLVRASDWGRVGGMDADAFPIAFNDVDLCLRLWSAGRRVLWTPDAVLIHHEGASRGRDRAPEDAARLEVERARLQARWGEALADDPFHHPVWRRGSERLIPRDDYAAPVVRRARIARGA